MTEKTEVSDFSALALSDSLLQVVNELGFEKMTPIQAKSIPVLLQGKDLIGQSETGSGKTAAFALPILEKLNMQGFRRELQALILCPTRELCTQVAREIRKLGRRHPGLHVLEVAGGQPIFSQLQALDRGVHIVVGTPGRVLDHLTRKTLDLSKVFFLVLDEADRMLDMGFQEDMEKILKDIPLKRQTVFFSATYPHSIETMSHRYQNRPVRIKIEDTAAAPIIRQLVCESLVDQKFSILLGVLQQFQPESSIVFCNLKATVIEVTRELKKAGVSAACIHGDLEQWDRDRVMAKFRNQSIRVLVATDVAARGIDIENLDAVVNFDVPSQPEIYVHRIGRTGRAGKKGLAVSLIQPREKTKIQNIEHFTETKIEHLDMPALDPYAVDAVKKELLREAKMETLYISGGRKDKLRPGDILGALTGEAGGLNGADIGKIEIHDRFAYVAVSKAIALTALERLREGRIKGRKFQIELVR